MHRSSRSSRNRKYVQKIENTISTPTELGVVVNDLLVDKFPELIDYSFTATMENELDEIENREDEVDAVLLKDFIRRSTRTSSKHRRYNQGKTGRYSDG
jgi:DNA topoisomerase-1